ncbi:MAG: Lrp/AsnC family transcriptional regulator [Chloroflexi bacterium]|jgi:Lrp/AsnC family transcriptional regulator, regulator for asnA, asnC and gidA|nr:Lrp/AsnC family transcriptional regulator [Chloroflexota bacterium]MBT7079944.1 Lrp/AsnC family transcriptional regulator [Chloroflexota bacterium]MBT7290236.1 Lrp/AsnC family transcriptional regulator [Chloroflexota bacterium]
MLDELDLAIIQMLEIDGRERYVDIAKRLGVVEGTIRKRVKRLLEDKVMTIQAQPDPKKLGFNVIAIMGLNVQMSALRHVAKILQSKPNVQWLSFISGRYDLMALIIEKSTDALSKFIEKEISAIPSITRTETFINLDIVKGLLSDTISLIDTIKRDVK